MSAETIIQYLGQGFFLLAMGAMLWMGFYSDVKGGEE